MLNLHQRINKAKADDRYCREVAKKTGNSVLKTKRNMNEARKKLGISYKDYCRQEFYNLSFNQMEEAYSVLLEKRRERKRQNEHAVKYVMEETGWTHDYAIQKMKEAKERTGIGFRQYFNHSFYEVPESEQKKIWQDISENKKLIKAQNKEKSLAKKTESIEKVMKLTGWSKEKTLESIELARENTGCTYKEYYVYGFFNMNEKEQNQIALEYHSKKLIEKYCTDRILPYLIRNKEKTNRYFDKWVGRKWCVNTKTSYEEFENKFANSTKVIYKPINGNKGFGVEVYDLNTEPLKIVYEKLSDLPAGVIEEYIVQHSDLLKLAPLSVNTIRIVTISQILEENGETRRVKTIFLYAALRIGNGKDNVDNFHAGGMVATIDLETGEVDTCAANLERDVYDIHPQTGIKIKGFKVPLFHEALEMVREMIEEKEIEGYIGWDIAVTDEKPVLVEVNTLPGVVLLQTAYSHQKKGMKYVFEQYL